MEWDVAIGPFSSHLTEGFAGKAPVCGSALEAQGRGLVHEAQWGLEFPPLFPDERSPNVEQNME